MTATEWIMLLALSIVWGGSFFFFKILVAELPVLTIVMVRVSAAAILLVGIVYLSGQRMPRSRQTWSAFGLMGIFNNVLPFSLIIWGETQFKAALRRFSTQRHRCLASCSRTRGRARNALLRTGYRASLLGSWESACSWGRKRSPV